jgi:four helix bundle protein
MKSSKSQAPSSRKVTTGKLQPRLCRSVSYAGIPAKGGAWVLQENGGRAPADDPPFSLEERAARFGEAIVRFAKQIPRGPGNNRLIDQVVGCGTSVGANYCEANESVSRKDFNFSISRCQKEAKETRFFLRMIAAAEPNLADEARRLYREASELLLILSSMRRK